MLPICISIVYRVGPIMWKLYSFSIHFVVYLYIFLYIIHSATQIYIRKFGLYMLQMYLARGVIRETYVNPLVFLILSAILLS